MASSSIGSRRRFLGTALCTAFVPFLPRRNTPQTVAMADDTRLAAPVTITRKGALLDDLLGEIAGSQKSLLTTRRQSGPWQIGWYRATAFAENVPRRTVLADIAELFGYEWQVPENTSAYVLYQNSESRQWEQRLRNNLVAQSSSLIQELARHSQESWEVWRRRRDDLEDSPKATTLLRKNVYYLARSETHTALRLLLTLTPAQLRTLADDGMFTFSGKGTSGPQQESVTRIFRERTGLTRMDSEERLSKEEAARVISRDLMGLRQFGFRIFTRRSIQTGIPSSFSYAIPPVTIFAGTFSEVAKERGLPYQLPVRGRPYPPDAVEPTASLVLPQKDEEMERLPFPPDWSLKQERIFESWDSVLESLKPHLPSRLRIYSDALEGSRIGRFSGQTPLLARIGQNMDRAQVAQSLNISPLPDLKGLSLAAGLDALCEVYGKLWWRRGDALFFRSRLWFREQEYEVPPQVEPTLTRLLNRDPPDIDKALLLLARLTPKQFMGYTMRICAAYARSRSLPVPSAFLGSGGQQMVLLYSTLRPDHRQRVLSADGLPFTGMDTAQQAEFARIVYFSGGPDALDRLRDFPLRAEMLESDKPDVGSMFRFITLRLSLPYRNQVTWETIGIACAQEPRESF